jgi:prepilin-type N-terminal cleavage/methylation domain-containing protein
MMIRIPVPVPLQTGDLRQSGTPSFDKRIRWPRKLSEQGFTLLELMIAVTLLAMGALRLASRSVAAGERRMENQERFRTVSSVMDAQIQSQLPLTYFVEGNRVYYFRGDRQTVRLTTSHSLWSGAKGYVLVDYRVENDQAGKQSLMAAEQTPGIEGKRETKLFAAADEISFGYYRRDPTDKAGIWVEQWSAGISLPTAIRLQVSYGEKKFLFLFPVRVQGEALPVLMTPYSATGVKQR